MFKNITPFWLLLLVLLVCNKLKGQGANAEISSITTIPNTCNPGVCTLCPGQNLQVSLRGFNLPNGSCVNWFYSPDPNFDPYVNSPTSRLIGCGTITTRPANISVNECVDCPQVVYAQVDGCGPGTGNIQLRGEFMIIKSGSGFNLNNLRFTFDPSLTGNATGQNTAIGQPFNCKWDAPTAQMITTVRGLCPCVNVLAAQPGQFIPANSYVVIFTNGGTTINAAGQDFSGLCGKSSQIYVLKNSCLRSQVSFLNFDNSNAPSQVITSRLDLNPCCSQSFTYTVNNSATSGDRIIVNGTSVTPLSPGCPATPNPPQLPNNPIRDTSTSLLVNLPITTAMCIGTTFYLKPAINPYPVNCARPTFPDVPSFRVECPVATAQNSGPVCPGDTIRLTATGGETYSWSGPGGWSSSLKDPIRVPSVAGVYRVTVTTSSGCTLIATTTVNILPLPPIARIIADSIICEGQNLQLAATPTAFRYEWTGPNNFNSLNSNPIVPNVDNKNQGLYKVQLTYPNGCKSRDSLNIKVKAIPRFSVLPTVICANAGLFDLRNTIDPKPTGGTWSGLGVTDSIFNPIGLSDSIFITFLPRDSCAIALRIPLFVTRVSNLTLSNSSPICIKDSVQLFANKIGNSILWQGPNGFASNEYEPKIFPPIAGVFLATVTFLPGNCLVRDSTLVRINPDINIPLNLDTTCSGITNFDLNNLLPIGSPSGIWFGNGVIGSRFTPHPDSTKIFISFEPNVPCPIKSSTIITILPKDTISIKPKFLCSNNRIFNLSTLLSSSANGVWSGINISGENLDPAGLDGEYDITFTRSGKCPVVLTTKVTVSNWINITTSDVNTCENGNPIDLNSLISPLVDGRWLGAGVLNSSFIPGNRIGENKLIFIPDRVCSNKDTSTIFVFQKPRANFFGNFSVCPSAFVPIVVNLTGNPPFSFNIVGSFPEIVTNFSGNRFERIINPTTAGNATIENLRDASGCPSEINGSISWNIVPAKVFNLNKTLCKGEFEIVNNIRFDESNPIGNVFMAAAALGGCDSIVNVNLRFRPEITAFIRRSLCEGETLLVGSTQFSELNKTGIVVLKNLGFGGCDSIIDVALNYISPARRNISEVLCEEDKIIVNGVSYNLNNPNGTEVIKNGSYTGCDSIINIDLKFRTSVLVRINGKKNLCVGDTANIEFVFSNRGNFSVSYKDGANNILNFSTTDSIYSRKIVVNATWNDSIKILSAVGSQCPLKIGPALFVDVSNLQISTEVFEKNGFNISCYGESDGKIRIIPSNGRVPYTFIWADGDNVNLKNNLSEGRYFFTVEDSYGCKQNSNVLLTEPNPIISRIKVKQPGCRDGGKGKVTVENINGGVLPYTIQLGDSTLSRNNNIFIVSEIVPGTYPLKLVDGNGCRFDTLIEISKINLPTVSIFGVNSIEFGDSVQLNLESNFQADSFLWNPKTYLNCFSCPEPISKPYQDIQYKVTLRDSTGCVAEADFFIKVNRIKGFFIPDVFSPNFDGNNDVFRIYPGPGSKKIKSFQIFDRWGGRVFEAANKDFFDPSSGWRGDLNGKALDPGVFVYWAEIEMLDGVVEKVSGEVSIMK
jgi:gliding motility-associated-like protein